MPIEISILYSILRDIASRPDIITYSELSHAYYAATNEWHDPHGSWDFPLGELNIRLHDLGLPPLSAVVVLNETKEPGGRFWGSTPGIPPRPNNDLERTISWSNIVNAVQATRWPCAI